MNLRSKSLLFISVGTIAFAIVFAAVTLYAFQSYSITDLRVQGRMAAELIRKTMTHEMDKGNPNHMSSYLNNLHDIPGLKNTHIIPAQSVVEQYNLDPERFASIDEAEKQVFSTAQPSEEYLGGDTFHYNIPYIATTKGEVNCLACHNAQEGDVIGAVSVEMDVSEQRGAAIQSVFTIVSLFLLFAVIMAISLRKLINPVIKTTADLTHAVSQGKKGDFSVRLKKHSHDEVGEIAEQTNQFMATLENSFGTMSKKVEALIGNHNMGDKNLLNHTASIVDNLVSATQFKQSIENDRDLTEVYVRLCRIITNQFHIKRFSLYEVSNSKNRLKLITQVGLPENEEFWCDREVTIDCDACRAKRTAQTVSSVEEEDSCFAFKGNQVQSSEHLLHVCIPILLSGSVGGILQVIFTEDEAAEVQKNLDTLNVYLSEAAPVIEAKRLMSSLKEASLRDPMTRLYNRRFLEEYLPTMLASAERQKQDIAILMSDVDFFKQVNDTLGHEVGDKVLVKVAEIIQQTIRASDLAIRFGGEEFIAILVGANEEKALEVAERLRTTMEEHAFQTPSGPLQKTISVGVSMFPTDGQAFWECVKFADVAMYQAKETGRNKVLRFTKDMWKDGDSY